MEIQASTYHTATTSNDNNNNNDHTCIAP